MRSPSKRSRQSKSSDRCPTCGSRVVEQTRLQIAPFPEDATEGQQADYMMAVESGGLGDWAEEVTERFCPKCEPPTLKLAPALGVQFDPTR